MFRTLRPLVLLGLLAAPGLSSALTTLCVSNSQQLASALQSVNAGADNLILIKLRRGTYTPPAGGGGFNLSLTANNRTVEVSGGWTGAGNSCTDKNFGAAGTLIKGEPGGSAFKFNLSPGSTGNFLGVYDLSFTAPDGDNGACLRGSVPAGNSASLDRLRFDRCVAYQGVGSVLLVNTGGELTLRNTVVRGGVGELTGGINIIGTDGVTRLSQLSITANRSQLGVNPGGLYINPNGPGRVYLDNSVVWGNRALNGPSDISNNGSGLFVINHVRYGALYGSFEVNNSSSISNPGFVASSNPGLRADSPLINVGNPEVIGGPGSFDVEGMTRVQGSKVDIGAYEGTYSGDEIFREILP